MNINENDDSSSLKGVRDEKYLLGLTDLEGSPGTYTFVVCAHENGEIKHKPKSRESKDQCSYAFLNDQRKPIPISVDFFPEEDLTVKELDYFKTISSQYWGYRSQLRDDAYDTPAALSKVTGVTLGGGAGAFAFGKYLKIKHDALDSFESGLKWPLEEKIDKLENKFKVMSGHTHSDALAAKAVRNLIDAEVLANESVFDDSLVKWLDAEGLPSAVRAFLSNNGFSIGHYLQNPYAFYHELLTDAQRQALVSVLGQESDELGYSFVRVTALDDMVGAAMRAWLVQSGQAVNATLLFKARLRETIVNQFLKKYGWDSNAVLSRMGSARSLPKSVMMNYHIGLEDPHHLALLRNTEDYLFDTPFPVSDIKSSNYYAEFSSMKPKFHIDHAFAKGVSNHYDIFYKVVPYRGYRWLALQNQISVSKVKLAKMIQRLNNGGWVARGLPALIAKRHRVTSLIAGAVAAGVVTFGVKKTIAVEHEQLYDEVPGLIFDPSSAVWQTGSYDGERFEEIASVPHILKSIAIFQYENWIGPYSDSEHQDESVIIEKICLPDHWGCANVQRAYNYLDIWDWD